MKTTVLAATAAILLAAGTATAAGAAAATPEADPAQAGRCLSHGGNEIRCLERREPTRDPAMVSHAITMKTAAAVAPDAIVHGGYEFWNSSCGSIGTRSGTRPFSLTPGATLSDRMTVAVAGAAPPPMVTAPRCFEVFAFNCRIATPDGQERAVDCDKAIQATTALQE